MLCNTIATITKKIQDTTITVNRRYVFLAVGDNQILNASCSSVNKEVSDLCLAIVSINPYLHRSFVKSMVL